MNECVNDEAFDPAACDLTVNRWIVSACADAVRNAGQSIEAYRFNEAASTLYSFVWHTFCDWYLEISKPALYGEDGPAKAETRATAAWVLARTLEALHPLMPFVTEALHESFADGDDGLLIGADWPALADALIDPVAREEMDWVVRLISEVRSVRAEMNVPPGATVPLLLTDASDALRGRFETHRTTIETLARVEAAAIDPSAGDEERADTIQIVLDDATLLLKIADLIDIAEERARLERELAKITGEIAKIDKKLGNAQFLERAPEAVVEEQRERRADADLSRQKLDQAVARLNAL